MENTKKFYETNYYIGDSLHQEDLTCFYKIMGGQFGSQGYWVASGRALDIDEVNATLTKCSEEGKDTQSVIYTLIDKHRISDYQKENYLRKAQREHIKKMLIFLFSAVVGIPALLFFLISLGEHIS